MNEEYNFKDQNFDQLKNFKFSKKIKFFLAVAVTLFLAFNIFINTPVFYYKSPSSIMFVAFWLSLYTLIFAKKKTKAIGIYIVAVLVVVAINVYSNPIFHSQAYYDLIGEVQEFDYKTEMPNLDDTKIPVVDQKLAEKLGDKVLGNDIGLGSQYTVGEYYFVTTADDLAWVAPLEPLTFFKWFQNKEGAPGYVYVSATNPNDVRLVKQNSNNEDIKVKYSNSSFFMSNIERYAYFMGNYNTPMTDFSFEIDDLGNPYWVISTYAPTIGFSGYDTSGVIVIDAQTGERNYYTDINETPEWVERVEPEAIIDQQINYWGLYKNGWLNSVLAQDEVITQTEGHSYVFVEGEPYYYSGLTSITSDESTVGFMLVNLRSGNAEFYKINGATETAAQASAEGQVQQFSYTASFPLLMNLYEKPTYFMTLKDQDGLVKQYAYVSVENYNVVGVGSSVEDAKKSYYDSLKANNVNVEDTRLGSDKTGTIERINKIDAYYYVKINGDANIYKVGAELSPYLVLSQPGDTVTFKFIEQEGDYKEVIEFKNTSLGE